ncbi:MAG: chemotaxis protein CheA [Bacteroidales bacterium]
MNIDKFKEKFIEEASDNIHDLENALLELEENTTNKDLIERVFRAMHSLKGGGAMFGFNALSEFTHNLETLYDKVRNGLKVINRQILDVTFESADHMKSLLSDETLENNDNKVIHKQLSSKIEDLIVDDEQDKEKNSIDVSSDISTKTYYIYFEPNEDIFANGTNPLYLIDELHTLGNCEVFAHFNKIPLIDEIDINKCYTYWEILLATSKGENNIADVFIFVEDQCKLEINELVVGDLTTHKEFIKDIKRLAIEKKDVGIVEIKNLIKKLKLSEGDTIHQVKGNEKAIETVKVKESAISSIRVSSAKLDQMMNLVSELVTTQARLTLFSEKNNNPELNVIVENMQKLSRQIRDNAFDIVLIPIETMLTRFQRLVRDLSRELKKNVVFEAIGSETELDKTIIETLTDPLLHILRNCLDHGIEVPEVRKKLGKPEQGKIILKAFYSGTNVHIQIIDDGAGIDPQKIRKKAIQKGMISESDELSDHEIFDLIFKPGFSTAENVTDVSGRGVGMDVVKRNINELRGDVVVDSEINKGTTLTIKLPLTLSIIDGLLVGIENDLYVLPLSVVNKIHVIEHQEIANKFNNLIVLDSVQYSYFTLRKELDYNTESPKTERVILVSYEDSLVGLVVDEVYGENQAVLKTLGKLYKNQAIISGATILGDGSVALVIDTNKMIKQFSKKSEIIN